MRSPAAGGEVPAVGSALAAVAKIDFPAAHSRSFKFCESLWFQSRVESLSRTGGLNSSSAKTGR